MTTTSNGGGRNSSGGSRQTRAKKYTTDAAKAAVIDYLSAGLTIGAALEKVGYARKTYEDWRRKDKDFALRADQARQLRMVDRGVTRNEWVDFTTFRKKYLHTDTPLHQQQWVDLLEGRDPRELHDAQVYEPARKDRIVVNCPPFHGKSVAITIDYTVYRLCMDPSYRVILISAGAELAKDFLFGVKQRLTSPEFIELQKAYAPEGGFESTAESWTDGRIVFGVEVRRQGKRDTHEKDANVIALGMRSKVYGRRADLIIVDDGVDTTNVAEHAKQLKWLRSMVESRLEAGGKLLVIGTRVAPIDLYSELRNPDNYANGRVPWTYFASPAILEEAEDPKDHKTLWPHAQFPWVHPDNRDQGEVCLCGEPSCSDGFKVNGEQRYARWDGPHLEAGPRAANSATDWALIYQQTSLNDNMTFPEHAVKAATNGLRLVGNLKRDMHGHPISGMDGKYVIAGCDPSIKGFAGIVVGAVDKESSKRYILDARNLKAPTAQELKQTMKDLTVLYNINEWRVEKTGLLQFFTQDQELRTWFASRGVRFTEHLTGSNKWDAGFGVSSMSSLFGEYDKAWDDPNGKWRTITEPLIELPRIHTDGIKALQHQLLIWTPELDPGKTPCDLVMALWFFNTGAREYLGVGRNGNVLSFGRGNQFVSPRNQKTHRVSLADFQR